MVFTNWTSSSGTKNSEVWAKLYAETKPEDLAETAKRYPGTVASEWALLHAANEYYALGMADLPNNRDVAVSNINRALGLYEQVEKEAPKDSFQARAAALGTARCLEARNELARAIEQYEKIATTWPDSPEATKAKELADALKKPEAAAFYKELFTYNPPKVTLPPLGDERLNFPGGSSTRPGVTSPSSTVPGMPVEVTPPDITEIRPAPGLAPGNCPTTSLCRPRSPSPRKPRRRKRRNDPSSREQARKRPPSMWPPSLSENPLEFEVKSRIDGKRIDAYLASRFTDYSRQVLQKVIDAEGVLGQRPRGESLVPGPPRRRRLDPASRIAGAYARSRKTCRSRSFLRTSYLTVVNKPAGMVTHPARGNWRGTLVNALQFHFDRLSTLAGENRPGIVHRLDRDTTGLLVVAKDERVHHKLAYQFEHRKVQKEYLAIVYGVPQRDSDFIEQPIGFHPVVAREDGDPFRPGRRQAGRHLLPGGRAIPRLRPGALPAPDRADASDPDSPDPRRASHRGRQALFGPRPAHARVAQDPDATKSGWPNSRKRC